MESSALRGFFDPRTPGRAVALYLLLAPAFCFWRLGSEGLMGMEGMIADGARRMLASGEWIVPHVYGEIYTFKPALAYWLAAPILAIFDPAPEWLLRLPGAAAGFLMGLVVLLLVARVRTPRMAFLTAMAVVASGLFVQQTRVAEFDMPLVAGSGVALAAAAVALAGGLRPALAWPLAYAGLLFGFLAKGAPALMVFGPGLLTAALVTGRWHRLLDWRHLVAALAFVLAAGGYLLAGYRAEGPAVFEQPLLEARLRGMGWGTLQRGDMISAMDRDPGGAGEAESASPLVALARSAAKPVVAFALFLPFSLWLPLGIRLAWRGADGEAESLLLRSALGFLVAGLLVFMVIPTHESRYFLPLGVPVAILCAGAAVPGPARRGRGLLIAAVIGGLLTSVAMLIFGTFSATPPVAAASRGFLVVGGGTVAAWAILAWRRDRRRWAIPLMLVAAAGWLATEALAARPRRASRGRDLQREAIALRSYVPPGETVWVLGPADLAGKESSLYFYLRRPIKAFWPPLEAPPPGPHCLLVEERLSELQKPESLVFEPIARVAGQRRTYLLGRCSG